jgi:AraC family transcriptional regulator
VNEEQLNRWRSRLERAAKLLSARLDDPPCLEELAKAAAVSPFHFHRIWRALTGETVRETLLRLRLEMSRELLQAADAKVSETALAVGFATPQSFARAFRRQTGMTPSDHRAQSASIGNTSGSAPRVAIEQRGETLVVALRRDGRPYTDLNASFGAVWSWAQAAGTLPNLAGIYGIPLDDPASVPESELRYEACLALGVGTAAEPFHILELPAGPYASLRHVGSYDGLEAATQHLVGEWLPASGREPADFPAFHRFINDPDCTPVDELLTDILLALEPRGAADHA